MNQFKHAKWWRSYLDKLKGGFWKFTGLNFKWKHEHKQRECKEEKQAKWRGKQRTAAAVFFWTFGALPEVHFLHAIYHFKAQEVKNPTLQTVYNLELKWGRYGLRKTTASNLVKISQGEFLLAKFRKEDLGTLRKCRISSVSPRTHHRLPIFFSLIFSHVNSFCNLVINQWKGCFCISFCNLACYCL